eukprot:625339-Prorocentrum_minimum.AAC.1
MAGFGAMERGTLTADHNMELLVRSAPSECEFVPSESEFAPFKYEFAPFECELAPFQVLEKQEFDRIREKGFDGLMFEKMALLSESDLCRHIHPQFVRNLALCARIYHTSRDSRSTLQSDRRGGQPPSSERPPARSQEQALVQYSVGVGSAKYHTPL